jgi:uncharacterized protein (DUF2267 family)
MSKKQRIFRLARRCRHLRARIETDSALLKTLERKLTFIRAEHAVEQMPSYMRNILVDSSRASWDEPRKPVINDES